MVEQHHPVEARLVVEVDLIELAGTDARVAAVDRHVLVELGCQHGIAAHDALTRGVVDARTRAAGDGIHLVERERLPGDDDVGHAGSE